TKADTKRHKAENEMEEIFLCFLWPLFFVPFCGSRFSDFVRGADAAWRKWTTSIVGGDFTVSHRERQTIPLRVALLDVFNTRGIAFQNRDFILTRVLDPVSSSL